MSPRATPKWSARVSFPRVSGDEPLADAYGLAWTVFSPRERG